MPQSAEALNQCLTDIYHLQQEIGRLTDSITVQQDILGGLHQRLIHLLEVPNNTSREDSSSRSISPLQVLKAPRAPEKGDFSHKALHSDQQSILDYPEHRPIQTNSPDSDEGFSTHSDRSSLECDTEDSGSSPLKLKQLYISNKSFSSTIPEFNSPFEVDDILSDPLLRMQDSKHCSIKVEIGLLGRLPAKMKPNSQEDPVAVFCAADADGKNSWRFIKDRNQLYSFDARIRTLDLLKSLPQLPARHFFQSVTPWKVDVRIDMLNAYFNRISEIRDFLEHQPNASRQFKKLNELLINFSRTDLVDMPARPTITQGFLMRRTRFGQWKANYYVLNGSYLDIFTQPEGAHLNTINLTGAQCHKLQVYFDGTADDMRYVFTITEAHTKGVYHFSAENEAERSRWIDAICERLRKLPGDPDTEVTTNIPLPYTVLPSHHGSYCIVGSRKEVSQAINCEPVVPRTQTTASPSGSGPPVKRLPPSIERQKVLERGRPQIVGGIGPTFGVNPEEAALLLPFKGSPTKIPSIVARCLHLLVKQQAYLKEGLFRVSGVQSLLDDLEYEFDTWSDFDLLAAEIDIHTTATLLKRYFRKLPEPLMGAEWSKTHASRIAKYEPAQRVPHLRKRVAAMTDTNKSILCAFVKFIVQVLRHEPENKMSCHSLDIVLRPALGIPAAVLISLADNFDKIFCIPNRQLPPNPLGGMSSRETSQEPRSPPMAFSFMPQQDGSIEI